MPSFEDNRLTEVYCLLLKIEADIYRQRSRRLWAISSHEREALKAIRHSYHQVSAEVNTSFHHLARSMRGLRKTLLKIQPPLASISDDDWEGNDW